MPQSLTLTGFPTSLRSISTIFDIIENAEEMDSLPPGAGAALSNTLYWYRNISPISDVEWLSSVDTEELAVLGNSLDSLADQVRIEFDRRTSTSSPRTPS